MLSSEPFTSPGTQLATTKDAAQTRFPDFGSVDIFADPNQTARSRQPPLQGDSLNELVSLTAYFPIMAIQTV